MCVYVHNYSHKIETVKGNNKYRQGGDRTRDHLFCPALSQLSYLAWWMLWDEYLGMLIVLQKFPTVLSMCRVCCNDDATIAWRLELFPNWEGNSITHKQEQPCNKD